MDNIQGYEVREADLRPRGWHTLSRHEDYYPAVSAAITNSSKDGIVYVVRVFTDGQEELAWPKAV